MGRQKVKLSKIIPLYRDLLLEEARLRLAHGFRPFVGMMTVLDGGSFLSVQEVDSGKTDAQKDEFIEQVRRDARSNGAVAVWFGARGWTAPDWKPRPSKHPEGKRVLLLFESAVTGDQFWQAMVIREEKDGRDVVGRWFGQKTDGGRFVNLLGSGPRLVKEKP